MLLPSLKTAWCTANKKKHSNSRQLRNSWIDGNITADCWRNFRKTWIPKRRDCYILHWDVEKRNHFPYKGLIMPSTKEGKIFHMKWVGFFENVSEQHLATLKKHPFEIVLNNKFASLGYQYTQLFAEFLNITSLRSEFNDQPSSNMNNFPLCTQILSTTFWNYFLKPDPLKRTIHFINTSGVGPSFNWWW